MTGDTANNTTPVFVGSKGFKSTSYFGHHYRKPLKPKPVKKSKRKKK